jgi:phosphoesterase RecJ-like protein
MIEEIKLSLSGRLVYSVITQEMLRKTGCREEDTTGFIGELRSIKGVECAVLFIEGEAGETRVSFRSKKWFDVSEVAVHFGGGGHLRASGCTLRSGITSSVESVINYVQMKMTENNPMNRYQNPLR